MFFEGAEKRVEIRLSDLNYSLINDLPNSFWYELVACSNAKILSTMQNKQCKAFVLSESSLFVWHNRFVILTCGVTNLVNSIEYFIQYFDDNVIAYLTYQRKNEYAAQFQPSSFTDDVKRISSFTKGTALYFGELDGHHTHFFYQESLLPVCNSNKLYQFFAHHISQSASTKLTHNDLTVSDIREFFQIGSLLKEFEIDDHVFEPYGYSVNALKGDKYITIHVTPQFESSYVSVESNINLRYLIPTMLQVLSPQSFDLLCFNDDKFECEVNNHPNSQYVNTSLVSESLKNNTFVSFSQFINVTS